MNAQVNSFPMKRFAWAGGVVMAVAGALILFFCDPIRVAIYPVCVFHRVTGLNCPACGSLRALHQLLHGNFIAALHFNAFTVLSLPLFASVGVYFAMRPSTGDSAARIRPLWIWLYLAAFVVFGILRELPVPALAAFSPR
jgi:hypothetical protein